MTMTLWRVWSILVFHLWDELDNISWQKRRGRSLCVGVEIYVVIWNCCPNNPTFESFNDLKKFWVLLGNAGLGVGGNGFHISEGHSKAIMCLIKSTMQLKVSFPQFCPNTQVNLLHLALSALSILFSSWVSQIPMAYVKNFMCLHFQGSLGLRNTLQQEGRW